jgi:hypothetical protein
VEARSSAPYCHPAAHRPCRFEACCLGNALQPPTNASSQPLVSHLPLSALQYS